MTATTDLPVTRAAPTLLIVSAAGFLASLDLFIVNIAFPDIRQAFGTANLGAMSWVLNAYTLVFAAFMTPAGKLGDRYGHRRLFLCGLAVFTVGSAACGLSGSFVVLVASRVIQALGSAMLMPSSLALLLAAVPAPRRPAAVSTWSGVAAMAAALGPPVGGFLVELSWRWIFFVNVPVGVLALIAGPLVLAKTAGTGAGIPDLFGALSLVLGVGALVWTLIELPVVGWGARTVEVSAVVGIVIWLCAIGPVPDYFANYLPAQLFTGAGVGLVMPSLSAAPGMALPSPRWGAGSALTNTARQLGMVLGTTVLTMIYQPGVDLGTVRRGWGFVAAATGTAALVAAISAFWWKPATDGSAAAITD